MAAVSTWYVYINCARLNSTPGNGTALSVVDMNKYRRDFAFEAHKQAQVSRVVVGFVVVILTLLL